MNLSVEQLKYYGITCFIKLSIHDQSNIKFIYFSYFRNNASENICPWESDDIVCTTKASSKGDDNIKPSSGSGAF
jgi:hypothetical protein